MNENAKIRSNRSLESHRRCIPLPRSSTSFRCSSTCSTSMWRRCLACVAARLHCSCSTSIWLRRIQFRCSLHELLQIVRFFLVSVLFGHSLLFAQWCCNIVVSQNCCFSGFPNTIRSFAAFLKQELDGVSWSHRTIPCAQFQRSQERLAFSYIPALECWVFAHIGKRKFELQPMISRSAANTP